MRLFKAFQKHPAELVEKINKLEEKNKKLKAIIEDLRRDINKKAELLDEK